MIQELYKLKEKKDYYYKELDELHMYEPSIDWYTTRRYELESEIAGIEEAINNIENDLKNHNFFKLIFAVTFAFLIGCTIIFLILL